MAEIRTLKLNLLADVDQFGRSIKRAETKVTGFEGTVKKATKMASAAFAALAASAAYAAVTIGKDAVKAAVEDQAAQAKLAKALQNTTKANSQQIASVEKWITKQQLALGISDKQLRPAYANLARATGDVAKAQNLVSLAMDVSAATGKDLESVSLALAKASNGNLGALKRLGIPLSDNIVKTKDFAAATAVLEKMFSGSAATAAGTYEGKLRRVKEALSEMQENLGTMLLPTIQKFVDYANRTLIPTLQRISDGMQGNAGDVRDAAYGFGAAIRNLTGSLSGLFKVFNGSNGGSVFNAILLQMEARMNRVARAIKTLTTGLNVIKSALGIKSSSSGAGYSESRDAARSAGRSSMASGLVIPDPFDGGGGSGGGGSKAAKRKKQIDDLAAAFKNYKDAIKGAITGTLDFASAFADKGTGSFMNALRGQAKLAYEFGGKIAKLVQMGLSRGALSQIVAAGPVAGSAIASELLSGGTGAIRETNQLVSGIEAFSNNISQYATAGVSGRGTASLGGNAINITINGAVDPQGTARALEKLFQDSARRAGALSFVGATL